MSDEERAAEAFRGAREELTSRQNAATTPPASGNPFQGLPGYTPAPVPSPPPAPWKGTILPVSGGGEGGTKFDSTAGLLGGIRNPIEYVGDVAAGRIPADVRNPAYIGGAFDTASAFGPGAVASRVGKGGVIRPSSEALKEAGEEGFKSYRASGQMYPGDEYRTLLQKTRDSLNKAGLVDDPKSASVQHRVINNEFERVRNAPFVTSADLDALRVQYGAKGPGAQNARENLFGYIEQNLPPNSAQNVRDAVGNYRQAMHADTVGNKMTATSRLNRSAGGTGELDAAQTRDNIARLLNSKNALKGFNTSEKAVMDAAVGGTTAERLAQTLGEKGRLNTGSVGMLALTAPLAGGAAAARTYANRGARRDASAVDDFIRAQSPLARQQFDTATNNFSAKLPGPYSVSANPAIAKAVADRLREGQPPQDIPQQYRVLPDGTVEELL
jgi:hypothetical protein